MVEQVVQRGFAIFILGDAQSLTRQSPEQCGSDFKVGFSLSRKVD